MSLVTARDNGTLGINQRHARPDSFTRNHGARAADGTRNFHAPDGAGAAGAAVRKPQCVEVVSMALSRVRNDWRAYRTRHCEVLWRIGTGGMTVFYCVLIIVLATWIARLTGQLEAERQRANDTAKLLLEVMENPQ